jgi:hypothetical protein
MISSNQSASPVFQISDLALDFRGAIGDLVSRSALAQPQFHSPKFHLSHVFLSITILYDIERPLLPQDEFDEAIIQRLSPSTVSLHLTLAGNFTDVAYIQ